MCARHPQLPTLHSQPRSAHQPKRQLSMNCNKRQSWTRQAGEKPQTGGVPHMRASPCAYKQFPTMLSSPPKHNPSPQQAAVTTFSLSTGRVVSASKHTQLAHPIHPGQLSSLDIQQPHVSRRKSGAVKNCNKGNCSGRKTWQHT